MPSTTLVGVKTFRMRHAPPFVFSHPVPFHVAVALPVSVVNVASHIAQSEAKVTTDVTVAVRNVPVTELGARSLDPVPQVV